MSAAIAQRPQNSSRQALRVLRPLLWWVVLVCILFLVRTHQRLSERTHLTFSMSLRGLAVFDEAIARIDGVPVTTGERISIGWHTFTVSHPKAEHCSTNLFIWYGQNNLGRIALVRAKGRLMIEASPAAKLITIEGPEFTVSLTNSVGMTSSVPTDTYVVEADYAHWHERSEISVLDGRPAVFRIAPRFSVIDVSCDQSGATFELLASDGRSMESGGLPAALYGIPEGRYTLRTRHHHNRRDDDLVITAGTNRVLANFVYGAAMLETEPKGATVADTDGTEYGVTPLMLTEVPIGTKAVNVHLDGYEPVSMTLSVSAHETNSFRTNLVSRTYIGAVSAARQFLAAGDYERALQASADALKEKPGDEKATAAEREARGHLSLRKAERLGNEGSYSQGIEEVKAALTYLPNNDRARALLAELEKHEAEHMERERQERMKRTEQAFDSILARTKDTSLFERHEFKTTKPAGEVAPRIRRELHEQSPGFDFGSVERPAPDILTMVGKQESSGAGRICVVVVGQRTEAETQILYEVLEYKVEPAYLQVLGTLLSGSAQNKYTPLHPSRVGPLTDKMKAQIEEGVRIVGERIERASE